MKKRLCAFALVLMLIVSFPVPGFADVAKVHWKEMKMALFGEETYPYKEGTDEKTAIVLLEQATSLAIDQHNKDSKSYLTTLQSKKDGFQIYSLPESISEINLDKNGNSHRQFSHLGWDFEYQNLEQGDLAKWSVRKKIMLSTAESIFDFNGKSNKLDALFNRYNEECQSFCALLYYVHILGDHRYLKDCNDYQNKRGQMISLAGNKDDTDAIIPELQKHATVLFGDAANKLVEDLDDLNKQARSLSYTTGNVTNEEEFEQYKKYVEDLFEILNEHLPDLLKEEAFFNKVFPNAA